MTIAFEERTSDSPFVETITQGWTLSAGTATRPAETRWHMVFSRRGGQIHPLMVGPWAHSGAVTYDAGAELLWIRFRIGVYMPRHLTRRMLNTELALPSTGPRAFWLFDQSWEIPTFENADTFVAWLADAGELASDPIVARSLQEAQSPVPERTLRHRFLQTTGLTQRHIRQVERAQQAAAMLRMGASILDTMCALDYYDQPHLTRSLKAFVGFTPGALAAQHRTAQQENCPASAAG